MLPPVFPATPEVPATDLPGETIYLVDDSVLRTSGRRGRAHVARRPPAFRRRSRRPPARPFCLPVAAAAAAVDPQVAPAADFTHGPPPPTLSLRCRRPSSRHQKTAKNNKKKSAAPALRGPALRWGATEQKKNRRRTAEASLFFYLVLFVFGRRGWGRAAKAVVCRRSPVVAKGAREFRAGAFGRPAGGLLALSHGG